MSRALKAAAFASGGGTNLQALIDHQTAETPWTLALLVCDREGAGALRRAEAAAVASAVIPTKDRDPARVARETLELLEQHDIEVIFLSGYLRKIPTQVVERFPPSHPQRASRAASRVRGQGHVWNERASGRDRVRRTNLGAYGPLRGRGVRQRQHRGPVAGTAEADRHTGRTRREGTEGRAPPVPHRSGSRMRRLGRRARSRAAVVNGDAYRLSDETP